jgi:hypothetical protein
MTSEKGGEVQEDLFADDPEYGDELGIPAVLRYRRAGNR